jgi:cell division protein ZapB
MGRAILRPDPPSACDVLEAELEQLEQRVQRLVAAYRQARLETKRAIQERDRLIALNGELRRRIEGVVDRVRKLENEQGSEQEHS